MFWADFPLAVDVNKSDRSDSLEAHIDWICNSMEIYALLSNERSKIFRKFSKKKQQYINWTLIARTNWISYALLFMRLGHTYTRFGEERLIIVDLRLRQKLLCLPNGPLTGR